MIPLAPVVAVGARAAAAIIITATLVRPITLTDADLRPGHLTTVWWDEACDCRRVVVEPIADDEPEDAPERSATTRITLR